MGRKNLDDYGFGYFLDPKERGQGLINRAIESLINISTKCLVVRQFVAFCEDTNIQSISVLKKLGFEPTSETLAEPSKGWIERKYTFTKE
ncbi:GNAT family N-acetyltransferase [Candidatus Woesebacteria bacterium]|nr:GNAT family N-acetyltransferase [Candidatus Woesebacteria bacterium]